MLTIVKQKRTYNDTYEYNSRDGVINYVVLGGHTISAVVSSLRNLDSSKEYTPDLSGFGCFVWSCLARLRSGCWEKDSMEQYIVFKANVV